MPDDLPNFLVIGAPKAGTTWLHEVLAEHPQVFLPRMKETAFFCNDHLWDKGVDWYRSMHFAGAGAYPARGEATPQYLPSERAPDRVRAVLGPDVRLIAMLRDPVERAWSWYWHVQRNGSEPLDFAAALAAEPERIADPERIRAGDVAYAYFSGGLYDEQLDRWLARFPAENLLVILHDDVRADRRAVLDRVCAHLGVPSVPLDVDRRSNVASVPRFKALHRAIVLAPRVAHVVKPLVPRRLRDPIVRVQYDVSQWILARNLVARPNPEIPPELAAALRERFAPSVRRLQERIGRDLSAWLP